MQRIGIAASKMTKDSLLTYNLFVILISTLFSTIIFFIGGFAILCIVLLSSLILHALRPEGFHSGWVQMFKICLIVLAAVISVFNLIAIFKNIQFTKNKI